MEGSKKIDRPTHYINQIDNECCESRLITLTPLKNSHITHNEEVGPVSSTDGFLHEAYGIAGPNYEFQNQTMSFDQWNQSSEIDSTDPYPDPLLSDAQFDGNAPNEEIELLSSHTRTWSRTVPNAHDPDYSRLNQLKRYNCSDNQWASSSNVYCANVVSPNFQHQDHLKFRDTSQESIYIQPHSTHHEIPMDHYQPKSWTNVSISASQILSPDVYRKLKFYHEIFPYRRLSADKFINPKEDFLTFINCYKCLDIDGSFDATQITNILTTPINIDLGDEKMTYFIKNNLETACFELYLGSHLNFTIGTFQQIDQSQSYQRTNFYAWVWDDYYRLLEEEEKLQHLKELGKCRWKEIWIKNIFGFQEFVSERNPNLNEVFGNDEQLLKVFFDWHSNAKEHSSLILNGGGAALESHSNIDASAFEQTCLEKNFEIQKRNLELQEPNFEVLAKKSRLAPNPSYFQAILLHLDETNIKSHMVDVQIHWRYLVPGAIKYYSDKSPPNVYMMMSYTERSESSLEVWVLTPDNDQLIIDSYNTDSNYDPPVEGVYSAYYECNDRKEEGKRKKENGSRKEDKRTKERIFRIVNDMRKQTFSIIVSNCPKKDIVRKDRKCEKVVTENNPNFICYLLNEIAKGKVKRLCSSGSLATINIAEAKYLEISLRICENIKQLDENIFPRWVAEEYRKSFRSLENQVNGRLPRKSVRIQSFGNFIAENKRAAYWALLFYEKLSDIILNETVSAKVAYDVSKILSYKSARALLTRGNVALQREALNGLYKDGFPPQMGWEDIELICKQCKVTAKEIIRPPSKFEVPAWFLTHWHSELSAKANMTLRRGSEAISRI